MSIVSFGSKFLMQLWDWWNLIPDNERKNIIKAVVEKSKPILREFYRWSADRVGSATGTFADFIKQRGKKSAPSEAELPEKGFPEGPPNASASTAVALNDDDTARIIRHMQEFMASDAFRDQLSEAVDRPKRSETEDQFVDRGAAILRRQLEKLLKENAR